MGEIIARLELARSEGTQSIPLELGSICSIGRDAQNTIVLDDASVSRRHVMIDCQSPGDCYVIDSGSRNGTFLNGARVGARTRLNHGDRLKVGTVPVTFWLDKSRQADGQHIGSSSTTLVTAVRYVTVVVADIRDFTGLTRRLGETLLSNVIGEYMQIAGEELGNAGAATQKYIGDAVMGVWDYGPDPPVADAVRPALTCAVRLFDNAADFQKRFGLEAPLKIGVGMNTGLAVLGNLGSRAASDYTALGDTINKAFRLESASKDINHDLVIGRSTWECLSSHLQSCFHPCVVTLKGYEQPEVAYGTSGDLLNALRTLVHKAAEN
jgi:adenylate cyclase